jgi:hypothetical protein
LPRHGVLLLDKLPEFRRHVWPRTPSFLPKAPCEEAFMSAGLAGGGWIPCKAEKFTNPLGRSSRQTADVIRAALSEGSIRGGAMRYVETPGGAPKGAPTEGLRGTAILAMPVRGRDARATPCRGQQRWPGAERCSALRRPRARYRRELLDAHISGITSWLWPNPLPGRGLLPPV